MNFAGSALSWFALGDASTAGSRALLVEQFAHLRKQMPVLFAILIIESISIAYVLPANLGWVPRFGVPALLIAVCVLRLLHWLGLKGRQSDAQQALQQLALTRRLTIILSLAFSAWAIAIVSNLASDVRALVSLLFYLGAIGSAYCLGSFVCAARITLLFTALPMAVQLLASATPILAGIGINLCLLWVLFFKMINTNYARFVELVHSRTTIHAERERARRAEAAALEEQANAKQIAARFDTALNKISQGLCFFDGGQRLSLCNHRYLEIYDLPAERVRPGMGLHEIAELRREAGSAPRQSGALGFEHEPTDRVVELGNGRVVEIRQQPMPDGGWVATHEDVTERYQAERALATAVANAERAENEARAAHATLVSALGAIPEGLAVFDAADRLTLWNRRYVELCSGDDAALAVGMRFEDLLRAGLARRLYPDAEGREPQWLAERRARRALSQSTHEQQLSGAHRGAKDLAWGQHWGTDRYNRYQAPRSVISPSVRE